MTEATQALLPVTPEMLTRMSNQISEWETDEPRSDWWQYQRDFADAHSILSKVQSDQIIAGIASDIANGLTESQSHSLPGDALPKRCDGIEQPAFEEWARAQGFDMTEHPLHYLFLDAKTDAARQAWAAGLKHASDRVAAALAHPSLELVEALELFARLEIPTERVGNAGFYSIPFDRIEKAKAAIARAALTPSALSDLQRLGQEYDGEAGLARLVKNFLAAHDLSAADPASSELESRELDAISDLRYALDHPAQATPSALSGDAGEGE